MNQNSWVDLLFAVPVPANFRQPNGIIFDNILFTEPISLRAFPPLSGGGIYVVLVPDLNSRPRTYRPIYVGQTGDLSERVCESHERFLDWVMEAGGVHRLYVAFHAMTAGKSVRLAVENKLIGIYKPVCNDKAN
jgi:hypothetical protein